MVTAPVSKVITMQHEVAFAEKKDSVHWISKCRFLDKQTGDLDLESLSKITIVQSENISIRYDFQKIDLIDFMIINNAKISAT